MNFRAVLSMGITLILMLGVSSSFAQQYEDVVYLKDGEVRRGLILEKIAGESVKIETRYGETFVISMSDISKIEKEEKPTLDETISYTRGTVSGVKLESWYTYWGLGTADMSYTGELDSAQGPRTSNHFSMGADLFGFYFPLKNKQTIVGTVLNLSTDEYWEDSTTSYQLSASVMHFFLSPIGKGPFIRADFGLAKFETVTTITEYAACESGESFDLISCGFAAVTGKGEVSYRGEIQKYPGAENEIGPGLLLGVGFGVPRPKINGGKRFVITLFYALRPGPQGINRKTGERHPKGMVKVFGTTFGGLF